MDPESPGWQLNKTSLNNTADYIAGAAKDIKGANLQEIQLPLGDIYITKHSEELISNVRRWMAIMDDLQNDCGVLDEIRSIRA